MKVLEKPLVEICEFLIDGTHGSPERSDTGIPVLSAQNVKDGVLNFKTDRFAPSHEYDAVRRRYTLQEGDFLLTIVGTIGRAAIVEESREAIFQRSVAMMRLKPDLVLPRYMFHYSQSDEFQYQLSRRTNQAAQAGIYLKKLGEVPIPLPPLEEQKRIAAILDQADALRRLRARALDRLNALGQAIFHEMFGERIGGETKSASLGQIAAINPTRRFSADQDFPVAFLPMSAVSEAGQIERAETRSLSEVKKGYTYFEAGDVLLAKITPCFENMKGCIFHDPNYAIGFGSTEFHVLRPTEACTSEFLLFLTRSSIFRRKGEMNMTGSAGQKRVPSSFISAFPLDPPSIAEQREFSRRVTHITAVRPKYLEAERRADAMFASLQQRAFSGDL